LPVQRVPFIALIKEQKYQWTLILPIYRLERSRSACAAFKEHNRLLGNLLCIAEYTA